MQVSAKKQKGLTQCEVEAQNMVNEAGSQGSDDIDVTDEARYEELLASRKSRGTVSTQIV